MAAGELAERIAYWSNVLGVTGSPFDSYLTLRGLRTLPARLRASEVTGAESYLHLDHSGDRWIALVDGVHQPEPGQALTVWLDPAHVYLFGSDGLLARPAPYAQAA